MGQPADNNNSGGGDSVQALWRVPKWYPKMQPQILETLRLFHVELLKFNAKVNLIGRGTERDSDEAHFADSILGSEMILKHSKTQTFFDIGSGNGLPGVVLAIMDGSRKVILVESDARKAEFLKQIIHRLGLKNVEVKNTRFEQLPPGSVDAAISRGFANITKAVLAGNKAFHKDSMYYHMKGNTWSREIAEIPSQLCAVWTPELVGEYSLPDTQVRRAIVVTKKIT